MVFVSVRARAPADKRLLYINDVSQCVQSLKLISMLNKEACNQLRSVFHSVTMFRVLNHLDQRRNLSFFDLWSKRSFLPHKRRI